jgi:hypothetical protein
MDRREESNQFDGHVDAQRRVKLATAEWYKACDAGPTWHLGH